jgi:hypothetical protein
MVGGINKNVTVLLAAAITPGIILHKQYANAAPHTDPLTGKTSQYPDVWTPISTAAAAQRSLYYN